MLAVMREQERTCLRLLELAGSERGAVAEGRIDLLERSTRQKGVLLGQMEKLEEQRRRIASRLAQQVGLPGEASLVSIAGRLSGEDASELMETRRRVGDAVGRLKEINEGNLLLIRQALGSVRDSIRRFALVAGTGECYTMTGRPRLAVEGNLMVDRRA